MSWHFAICDLSKLVLPDKTRTHRTAPDATGQARSSGDRGRLGESRCSDPVRRKQGELPVENCQAEATGDNMPRPTIVIKSVANLSTEAMRRIEALVTLGDEVENEDLDQRLARCQKIAIAKVGDELTCTAALKAARPWKNASVSKMSGFTLSDDAVEFGYVVTHPEFRQQGMARDLCAKILETIKGNLYATVRSDNDSMRRILESNGFVKAGHAWASRQPDKSLNLWIRESISAEDV
jgi:ribosomal protein S18 acetylase RimI-like enzyme